MLRWHIQLGNIVIPKSVTPSRIEENFRIFDFELSEEDMHALFELDRDERTGPDPDTFGTVRREPHRCRLRCVRVFDTRASLETYA